MQFAMIIILVLKLFFFSRIKTHVVPNTYIVIRIN